MSEDPDPHLVLRARLDNWLALSKWSPDRPPLLEHMQMTIDEFIEWRHKGRLPMASEDQL
jgi:hypothetical protein